MEQGNNGYHSYRDALQNMTVTEMKILKP